MFRVLTTIVLMALLAMPHGVCLCPVAHASEPALQHCCDDAAPSPAPTDDADDHEHDHDCPCKLRQVPLIDANLTAARDDQNHLLAIDGVHAPAVCFAELPSGTSLQPFESFDGPLPLIRCALRI